MQQVEEHLFIGSVVAAWNESLLIENGIQHVLTVMRDPLYDYRTINRFGVVSTSYKPKTEHTDHISYMHLLLHDNALDHVTNELLDAWTHYLHQCIEAKQNVLVHCYAGRSRSALIVMAYLIQYRGMSDVFALRFLRLARSMVKPNLRYRHALARFAARCGTTEPEEYKDGAASQQDNHERKRIADSFKTPMNVSQSLLPKP